MGAPKQVQISHIAGRYLVFDHDDISLLRRHHDVCGVLTGTVPQSPTQNVFLGVPLEVRQEDVTVLVEAGVAAVRDENQTQLAGLDVAEAPRRHYVDALRLKRKTVERAYQSHLEKRLSTKDFAHSLSRNPSLPVEDAQVHSPQAHLPPLDVSNTYVKAPICSVSPTVIRDLQTGISHGSTAALHLRSPLHMRLHAGRFFMTPGLRFGAHFSVYPGDPFRYHAHFLANDYKWDDEIPLLDLVGAGRLSTAVKKGFLAGGEVSTHLSRQARVFCVEWAGM